MANPTTIARPYAKAVIDLAKQDNSFVEWSTVLQFFAAVAEDPAGYKFLSNIALAAQAKTEFLCELLPPGLTAQLSAQANEQVQNLLKLLARGKRLLILPQLYNLYEKMRMKLQGIVTVQLFLAQDLAGSEIQNMRKLCAANIGGEIIFTEHIDEHLIGGGVAQIDNRVIDASISGRLQALRNVLRK